MATWEERYQAGYGASHAPSPFVVEQLGGFPAATRLVDLAGGRGRHAIWAAERGMVVTLVDLSETALALAARACPALRVVRRDLEADGVPEGIWDVALVHTFLCRPMLARIGDVLAEGGLCVFVQPTVLHGLRHPSPSSRYLLRPGEARGLLPGLEVVFYEEGWRDGRHEARVVGRRGAAPRVRMDP